MTRRLKAAALTKETRTDKMELTDRDAMPAQHGGGGDSMTYAMSDIHGRYDRYQAMLSAIRLKSTDTLYVLGDVIDRGEDGIKILRDMSVRPNVIPILGNHEFTASVCLSWLLEEVTERSLTALNEVQLAAAGEWLANGGEPTIQGVKELNREEREDLQDYFREMALYAEVEAGGRGFVLAHAVPDNFDPAKPLDAYELQDFLFGRPDWRRTYYPDKILVFGHTPTRALWGKDQILRRGTAIDIDCGCMFEDGRLGCLCLDTLEEFYV